LEDGSYTPTGKIGDGITMHGITRDNVLFDSYKIIQESIAEETLEEMYRNKIINEEYLRK